MAERCGLPSEPLRRRPAGPASVGGMTEKPTPQDVDAFLDSTVVGDDPALAAAVESSNAAGLPPIAVSVQQGKFLCLLAAAIQARRILEIGTLGGCSSIWLARGAGPEGRVVTLEYEPKHAEVARVNLQRAGVADRVEVIVGAALDTLPTVTGPFDLVFIDADKQSYPVYLDYAMQLTRPGSLILADNVIRDGKVARDDETDPLVKGVQEFNRKLATNPKLEAILVTIMRESLDGLAIARVKE